MTGQGFATGKRGKRDVSEALNAAAEALVLADPSDPTSGERLAASFGRLAELAPPDERGDAVRNAARLASEMGAALARGEAKAANEDLTKLASSFDAVRAALEAPAARPAAKRAPKPAAGSQARPAQTPPAAVPNPLAEDPALVADFVSRAMEHLDSADTHLLTLERNPSDHEVLDATFRVFHTIKGMAGFLSFAEIEELAHSTETFLDGPRKGLTEFTTDAFDAVFAAVDDMRELVAARVGNDAGSVRRPSQADAGPVRSGGPGAAGVDAPAPGSRTSGPTLPDSSAPRVGETVVRVDETRLDGLLDTIGELVIAEAMASEAARGRSEIWAVLAEKFARLDKITRELQEMATSLRMVPMQATFRRMARLVRDLAHKADKEIEFVTTGGETELDKAMVDLLSDPLIHILRNAVDHGIETADERGAAGKPPVGRIELRAYHGGGSVNIEIADDGRGLDPKRLLDKARSQGLVAEGESPSEREVLDLIFRPGFTTAERVTDVSGRGVGMDVVKRAVEGFRGTVEVRSVPGEGTRFVLRLPLTLAIIDGMVLRVGDGRYIVPTLNIRRSVRPGPAQVSSVLGKGEVMSMPDGLIPLVRLDRLFQCDGSSQDPRTGIVVIVGENGSSAGLVASELLGQQQTVIKPLGEGLGETQGLSGGAIMSDGTVGLILDVSGLIRLANSHDS